MPNTQRRSFPRPQSGRAWLLSVVAAVVAVGAAGVLFIYFVAGTATMEFDLFLKHS